MSEPSAHSSSRQERVGAPVSGAAAVQHQRAVQRLRQVLLRPALAFGVQQPQLPPGAAQQRQGPETGGEIQLRVSANKTNTMTLMCHKFQICCICKEINNPRLSLIPSVFYTELKRVISMIPHHRKMLKNPSPCPLFRLFPGYVTTGTRTRGEPRGSARPAWTICAGSDGFLQSSPNLY